MAENALADLRTKIPALERELKYIREELEKDKAPDAEMPEAEKQMRMG